MVGHWAETVRYLDKVRVVESCFDPATGCAGRAAILEQFDVQFVVQGPAERALGGLDLHNASQMRAAYVSGQFEVFRVGRR